MRFAAVFVFVVFAALVSARPQQESELDNDIIPRDPQSPLQQHEASSEEPAASSSSTVAVTASTPAAPASPTKPQDFFTRLIDDFIQIPIAALRAVNQLLNNINLRKPLTPTTTTTAAPEITTKL